MRLVKFVEHGSPDAVLVKWVLIAIHVVGYQQHVHNAEIQCISLELISPPLELPSTGVTAHDVETRCELLELVIPLPQ